MDDPEVMHVCHPPLDGNLHRVGAMGFGQWGA
jgi:hypothetical protein